METVKVDKVIRSEKGEDTLVNKGFKFRVQKLLADNRCNGSREIFGGECDAHS